MSERRDRVEVYQDNAGEYRWRRRDLNGEIVSDSGEGYSRQSDATGAARAVNGDDVDYEGE